MKKILYTLCAAAALAAGCGKEIEDADPARAGEVRFSAGVESRAVDGTWETDDRVGVFAHDADGAAAKSNAQYKITNEQHGTMGTVADADKIYYPTGKSLIFYAYYPFTSDETKLIGTTCKIDASDQGTAAKTKALDLMWAKTENQTSTDVALPFAHKMVKLTFNLTAGVGDLLDLTGLTATLRGANATADFDLKTGTFSDEAAGDITLTVAVDATRKTVATVSAFVVPTADLSGVRLLLRAPGNKEFAWKPDTKAWTGGTGYIYTIWVGKPAPFTDKNFVDCLHEIYNIPVTTGGTIDPNDEPTATALFKITQLNVLGRNISSLVGIEHMPNLTSLYCSSNPLKSLDVSQNTGLTYLDCYSNSLESLDVSKNTKLTFLNCSSNSLESLDVSKNTKLTHLSCYNNSLTSLDLSQNTELTHLQCYSNLLTNLDLSQNTGLTELECYFNSLKSLDITKLSSLSSCYCGNQKTSGTGVPITLELTLTEQQTSIRSNDWKDGVTLDVQN